MAEDCVQNWTRAQARQVIGESAGEVVPDVEIGVSALVADVVVF